MPTVTLPRPGTAIGDAYAEVCGAVARYVPKPLAFDASLYDPEAVALARRMWRIRMASEYESSSVFLALAAQFRRAHATIDSQGLMARMAIDELRHAEVCGHALAAMGEEAACEAAAELVPVLWFEEVSREECALRNVVYSCCLTEVLNAARFVDTLNRTTDPCAHEAVRRLLSDELHHGAFGFHYLAEWAPWLAAHPEAREGIGRYLRQGFALLERTMSGKGMAKRRLSPDELALGLPDPERLVVTYEDTVREAIIPGLERFGIDAGAAYRERSLAPL